MDEQEWLACDHPEQLWEFVYGKDDARKLRLFIVSLYRQLWGCLSHPLSRKAIEVAERYADGQASEDERVEACIAANRQDVLDAAFGGQPSCPGDARLRAAQGATDAAAMTHYLGYSFESAYSALRIVHESAAPRLTATLLRDVFGNPFRPITPDPSWLTSTVTALAQETYDSRDFSAMPILTDALMDAGCDNEEILQHCRGPGPHVRGCWCVDILTGRA